MADYLGNAYPKLAAALRKYPLGDLPTAVSHHTIGVSGAQRHLMVKHDDQTSPLYGGNKVRKLEYLLQRALDRGAKRVATFGAAGSNHALATALFARQLGLGCTCFLAHQTATPGIAKTLNMHLQLGTEIVRYGGRVEPLPLFRRYLQHRHTWVIPIGGSSWLGAVGFVNAGLELAAQVSAGDCECPGRIYVANGTMGSAAGLAIGLALANLPTQVHAVRVTDARIANRQNLQRLLDKVAFMLQRLDRNIPADIAKRTRLVWRDGFFAGGYAAVDVATRTAVTTARKELALALETTYTGKAFAALLHDMANDSDAAGCLFWNTYSTAVLPVTCRRPDVAAPLPDEFLRYYD